MAALSNYTTEELKQCFCTVAAAGDLHVLTKLEKVLIEERGVRAGKLMDICDDMGRDALFSAVAGETESKLDVIEYLVEELNFNVNKQNSVGETPLHYSATMGDFATTAYLLDQSADPNICNMMGCAPLHIAAKYGHTSLLRLLISQGALLDAVSIATGTPIQVTTSHGNTEAVAVMLENRADYDDLTPIEIAAKFGNHADLRALFRVTKPMLKISDWSVDGIMEYVNRDKGKNKVDDEKKILDLKAKGGEAFERGQHQVAVDWYTEALKIEPANAAVLSNRSFCWARLKDGNRALQDAIDCIAVRNDWAKAHYRAGVAYALLLDYREAEKEFGIALKLDPENKDLQEAYREAVLDLRAIQMYEMKTFRECEEFEETHEESLSSLL